jgi:hypothetical protein
MSRTEFLKKNFNNEFFPVIVLKAEGIFLAKKNDFPEKFSLNEANILTE